MFFEKVHQHIGLHELYRCLFVLDVASGGQVSQNVKVLVNHQVEHGGLCDPMLRRLHQTEMVVQPVG